MRTGTLVHGPGAVLNDRYVAGAAVAVGAGSPLNRVSLPLSGVHEIRIGEIPSPRWDLALEKITDAGMLTVLDCEPPVGLQRYGG